MPSADNIETLQRNFLAVAVIVLAGVVWYLYGENGKLHDDLHKSDKERLEEKAALVVFWREAYTVNHKELMYGNRGDSDSSSFQSNRNQQ